MKFEQVGTANIYEKVLEPKSLLVLQSDARYKWKHSIPARKKDNNIPRSKRISLTFRKKK
jgi:alkylated DNA repair protein alkB family protein 8